MTVKRPWIHSLRPLQLPLALVLLFVVLAEVLQSVAGLDMVLTNLVHQLPQGLDKVFIVIADLGSVPVLIAVSILVAVVEFARRHWVRGGVMLASLLSLGTFFFVKETVRRARPVTDYVASHGLHDYSFPSGHSTGSAAVYGLLVVLLWHQRSTVLNRLLVLSLLGLIGLIGVSRVYLGAHYPTDVLGGWLLALVFVSGLRSLSLVLAKRSSRPMAEALQDTTESEAL